MKNSEKMHSLKLSVLDWVLANQRLKQRLKAEKTALSEARKRIETLAQELELTDATIIVDGCYIVEITEDGCLHGNIAEADAVIV